MGLDKVEVSTDGMATWKPAKLGSARGTFAWRRWELAVTPRADGPLAIAARASDATGSTQPLAAKPNAGGYGNNSIHQVKLHVA